ncbi:MAG: TRAP transporter small permease, partial [Anaerolineae bacterium]|nr:TRAP transporter small permease [Anaerolineae bacterium]
MRTLVLAVDRRLTDLALNLGCLLLALISVLGLWQVLT